MVKFFDAGFANPAAFDFRLGLTSGVPMPTDVPSSGTLYLTPYGGNRLCLYDGGNWHLITSAELAIPLASVVAGTPYDVFLYLTTAPAFTAELTAWSSASARSGYTIGFQDGVPSKSTDPTRRYAGTVYGSGAGTVADTATQRFVWNCYNPRRRRLVRMDPAGSWTYTATTARQANANPANKVELVCGLTLSLLDLTVVATFTSGVAQPGPTHYIGEDALAASAESLYTAESPTLGGTYFVWNQVRLTKVPAAGYHTYYWLEYGSGTACTFYGGPNSGLVGWIEC